MLLWFAKLLLNAVQKQLSHFSKYSITGSNHDPKRSLFQNELGEEDQKKGTQLLEIYALEIQMYTEQKNNKALKALYEQSLHVKSAIPHPLIMGVIRGVFFVLSSYFTFTCVHMNYSRHSVKFLNLLRKLNLPFF